MFSVKSLHNIPIPPPQVSHIFTLVPRSQSAGLKLYECELEDPKAPRPYPMIERFPATTTSSALHLMGKYECKISQVYSFISFQKRVIGYLIGKRKDMAREALNSGV